MKWLVRLLLVLMCLTGLLAGGFWWATVPDSQVPRTIIPFSDLRKYRQWMEQYHPARLESGEVYELALREDDVQKLAILLASTQPALAHSQFRADIQPDALTLELWWPTRVFERFLPVSLVWQPEEPFRAQSLTVAGFGLPASWVDALNDRLNAQRPVADARAVWQQLSPRVDLRDGSMTVSVEWGDPELQGWLGDFAPFWADGRQRERLQAEVLWLGDWLSDQEAFRIPLRQVLSVMVTRPDFDWDQDAPVMLGALTYASLGEVSGLKPGEDLPELPFKRFTLHGRYDLARHFLLAMWLGTQMSPDSVLELAVYKEWSDALTRRSGFSAEDMVANVAGLELLLWLQNNGTDFRKDFLPATDDTLMPPAEFWADWQQDDRGELTERQIRELVRDTRSWLRNSPLYSP
ncbi:hypothetical protein [Saccharospirillum salsuginis]|uniref:Uncharacterized protein n=1 Tax=Saccharospirillum salsuginis TaxID=418750 RepID=A0A918NIJ0_9GAMM|nr:hypothetical protein [Saccharospirillum salsuginis]GGX70006.1 hypothetical protein GCM10007392_42010 [Saccharospirillum salsuginis]